MAVGRIAQPTRSNCRFERGGTCHRHAPAPTVQTPDPKSNPTWANWPHVNPGEWCGEHQERSNGRAE